MIDMRDFKFRYVGEARDEALKELHPRVQKYLENETLEEKIGRDIILQTEFVANRVFSASMQRGVSEEEREEGLTYLQKCVDEFDEDGPDDDLSIFTLIKYAGAIGASLKISIEFPDGESAELL